MHPQSKASRKEAQLTVSLETEDREPVRILDGIRDV